MPAIIPIALGAAKLATDLVNKKKAKDEAGRLQRTRPEREISPYYGQNLSLVESELAPGLDAATQQAYNNMLQKQQSESIGAILRGGGSVNNVADVFAASEEGRQRLALVRQQARLNQINNVLKAREMSAEEADKNFIFNKWMPWADKAQATAQARKSADAGIWSALDTIGGGLNLALEGGLTDKTNSSGFEDSYDYGVDRPLHSPSLLPNPNSFNTNLGRPSPSSGQPYGYTDEIDYYDIPELMFK